MNFRSIFLPLYPIHKTFVRLVAANQCIGKGPRCSIIRCRCSPAKAQPVKLNPRGKLQQAQPKRKALTSTKTQQKMQKAAPSSPPHPAPQGQAESADAPEQTTKVRHRPLFLGKQLLLLLRVKYRS